MSEQLNQLSLWIEVLEYNFREHTLRGRFPNSKVEINFKLNAVVESQLLKIIDSGKKTPKRIKVFIEGSDILSLDSYDQLNLGKKEEGLQELRDIVKGKYSVAEVKKIRDQLMLEIAQSSDCTWFLDPELKKIADEIYFGVCEEGDHKDLRIYLKNNTEAVLKGFKISFDDSQIEVVKSPSRIFPHQSGEFILRYTNKGEKKPLNAKMDFSCHEIYLAKGHEEDLNEKE